MRLYPPDDSCSLLRVVYTVVGARMPFLSMTFGSSNRLPDTWHGRASFFAEKAQRASSMQCYCVALLVWIWRHTRHTTHERWESEFHIPEKKEISAPSTYSTTAFWRCSHAAHEHVEACRLLQKKRGHASIRSVFGFLTWQHATRIRCIAFFLAGRRGKENISTISALFGKEQTRTFERFCTYLNKTRIVDVMNNHTTWKCASILYPPAHRAPIFSACGSFVQHLQQERPKPHFFHPLRSRTVREHDPEACEIENSISSHTPSRRMSQLWIVVVRVDADMKVESVGFWRKARRRPISGVL